MVWVTAKTMFGGVGRQLFFVCCFVVANIGNIKQSSMVNIPLTLLGHWVSIRRTTLLFGIGEEDFLSV